MQPVQATRGEASVDCVLADAELEQLGPRHNPVLPPRQVSDPAIRGTNLSFPVYLAGNRKLGKGIGHTARVAGWGARVARRV